MKGLVISARDKLMYTLVLTIILFIGAITTVVIEPPYFGIMLILFDFLLAVIILLAATGPDAPASDSWQIVHQGRFPAVQPGTQTPSTTDGAAAADKPTA